MDRADLQPRVRDVAGAIETMETRGAANIADAAADALRAQADGSEAETAAALLAELRAVARLLLATRPTAVSLPNACRYVLRRTGGDSVEAVRASAVESVAEFRARLETAQRDLGQVGANRLRDGDTIMTHCHSTDALACVEAAVDDGKALTALVKETRPRKQGHITARELTELGVDVTMVVDSAARRYMNEVDHVLVGADAIAADGSVVNKIGTSGLAVVARERGTPVVVAAGTLKLDPATMTGNAVEIEMREESEVLDETEREAIGDISVENPAFDVTPPRYVDAIVTERGQFPPESIVTLMRELFGEGPTEPWQEP
ncbi:ribose 1,5-bisphosphate isomerase [Haloarcula sp. S1CR25-12]|uniref:Ribose 1,5-bisphosphate isomerase n=1 Tax=Haloarcula saliterrae TaxID=2950534 RepID=A0ABU2F7P3_9EURY|nr:ribose 1,5-bisphosphate isomerase [Haloarcula sp. S1CR25-12]MDS0258259.1 ribose 1,5-bisphosphate isomerase [Haloarcula sp. S1CR25-12]